MKFSIFVTEKILHILHGQVFVMISPLSMSSLQCYQSDKPETRTATTSVMVTVLDINEHLPIFQPTTYNVSLVENAIGYVTTVSATDLDQVPGPSCSKLTTSLVNYSSNNYYKYTVIFVG